MNPPRVMGFGFRAPKTRVRGMDVAGNALAPACGVADT